MLKYFWSGLADIIYSVLTLNRKQTEQHFDGVREFCQHVSIVEVWASAELLLVVVRVTSCEVGVLSQISFWTNKSASLIDQNFRSNKSKFHDKQGLSVARNGTSYAQTRDK